MKHIGFCLLVLMLAAPFSAATLPDGYVSLSKQQTAENMQVTLKKSADHLTIEFRASGFLAKRVTEKGESFYEISATGGAFTMEPGKPKLPVTGCFVQVPFDGANRVTLIDSEYIEFEQAPVYPYQDLGPRSDRKAGARPFHREARVYATDAWYPRKVYRVDTAQTFRDIRIRHLGISPFQANPARAVLRVYTRLVFAVEITGGSFLRGDGRIAPSFARLYLNTVLNPSLDSARAAAEAMLIIYSDPCLANLQPFIDWKRQKGYHVYTAPISTVGNTTTAIKAHIQNAYDSYDPAPSFVLLVGNQDTVVPNYKSTVYGTCASDYDYTLLAGGDQAPDIQIGRFIVDDADELPIYVAKSVTYEKEPYTGAEAAFYPKASGIASYEGSSPSDEEYIEMIEGYLTGGTYTHFDHFYQGDGTATATNINNALNEGRTWLTYIGHGSGTSWGSTNGSYSNSDIANTNNDFRLPIIIDVACLNGQYDKSWTCFGEAWLKAGTVAEPEGAVGYYGGSVSVSWDPPAIMAVGCAKEHYEQPVHTFGETCLKGQLYLAAQNGWGSDTIDNFEWYNIFGDPSLMWRTDVPQAISVNHPATVMIGQGQVTVTVSTSKAPAEGALLGITNSSGTVFGSAYTNSSGQAIVTFNQAPMEVESLTITATGYNLDTYQSTMLVIADGPYLAYSDHVINDALGNGNNQWNPGETILLPVELENVGPDNATNITATLSSTSGLVTINQNATTYPDINAGASSYNTGTDFSITLSDTAGHQDAIPLRIDWQAAGNTGYTVFSLPVYCPELVYLDFQVDDTVYGNGNGLWDPGERVALSVEIKNTGNVPATAVTGQISTASGYISFDNDTSAFGDIAADASGWNSSPLFDATADGSTPPSQTVAFDIDLSATIGTAKATYETTISFSLCIGKPPVLFVKDYDDEDFSSYIEQALDACSYDYDTWDIDASGSPAFADVQHYLCLVWSTGEDYTSTLSAADEQVIGQYLDAGGALLFTAQDYIYDFYGYGSFTTSAGDFAYDYLHVASGSSDEGYTSLNGVGGDPITNAMSFNLSFPSGLYNYADELNPLNDAAIIFTHNSQGTALRYPSDSAKSNFRTVFTGFPVEAIPAGERSAFMESALNWLLDSITPLSTPGLVSPDDYAQINADVPLCWSNVANEQGYTVHIRSVGGGYETDETLAANVTLLDLHGLSLTDGVEYAWKVKALGDGTHYGDSAYSLERSFTFTACTLLDAPQISAPAPSSVINTPYTFAWTACANTSGYQLQILDNGQPVVDENVLLAQYAATSPVLTPGTTYTMQVRALGNGMEWCHSDWSTQVSFSVNAVPVLNAIAPTSGTTYGGTKVQLQVRNISAAPQVSFGTEEADVSAIERDGDWYSITLRSPRHMDSKDATVTVTVTENGQSGSMVDGYTFHSYSHTYYIPVFKDTDDFRGNTGLLSPQQTVSLTIMHPDGSNCASRELAITSSNYTAVPNTIRWIYEQSDPTPREITGSLLIQADQELQVFGGYVDNLSNDPSIIPSQTAAQALSTPLIIRSGPWKTEIGLFNTSTLSADVSLDLYDLSGNPVVTDYAVDLEPLSLWLTSDMVQELGLADGAYGRMAVSADRPIAAMCRQYSYAHSGGIYPFQQHSDTITQGVFPLVIDTDAFRSNVGLCNISASPVDVTLYYYEKAKAATASRSVTVNANAYAGLNNVIRWVRNSGSGPLDEKGYLFMDADAQGVIAIGGPVDNVSDDPSVSAVVSAESGSLVTPIVLRSGPWSTRLVLANHTLAGANITLTFHGILQGQASQALSVSAEDITDITDVLAFLGVSGEDYGKLEITTDTDIAVFVWQYTANHTGGIYPVYSD